jgi:hypothetical protein
MQREGVTHSRVHSSLFTSQDKRQTQEKVSLGQECIRPFKDRGREDMGAGREGVPEVVAERQGRNATNGRGQRTHPPPCSPSPLPADPAPPPTHDQRSCLRRCAHRPQLSPSETLHYRNVRNALGSPSLRNTLPPVCAQSPYTYDLRTTLAVRGAGGCFTAKKGAWCGAVLVRCRAVFVDLFHFLLLCLLLVTFISYFLLLKQG